MYHHDSQPASNAVSTSPSKHDRHTQIINLRGLLANTGVRLQILFGGWPRCLPPRLMTWVHSTGTTGWKERASSRVCSLSSTCPHACAHTNTSKTLIYIKQVNLKTVLKIYTYTDTHTHTLDTHVMSQTRTNGYLRCLLTYQNWCWSPQLAYSNPYPELSREYLDCLSPSWLFHIESSHFGCTDLFFNPLCSSGPGHPSCLAAPLLFFLPSPLTWLGSV